MATDLANLRSYYAEIQADYISSGERNPKVLLSQSDAKFNSKMINSLNSSTTIDLKAGNYYVALDNNGRGYQIIYTCNDNHSKHYLELNVN